MRAIFRSPVSSGRGGEGLLAPQNITERQAARAFNFSAVLILEFESKRWLFVIFTECFRIYDLDAFAAAANLREVKYNDFHVMLLKSPSGCEPDYAKGATPRQ